jgi:hypothetical protein
MATRMQQRRGTAAQWISTNSGNGPILNAGEIGYETDTNKFKIGDGTNHWVNLDYFIDASSTVNPAFGSSITFEGATANDFETTVAITDPTADRTITLPDATGTVVLADGSGNVTVSGNLTVSGTTTTINSTTINATTGMVFEGATANDFETTLTVTDPTADRTLTLPDSTGTLATQDYVTNEIGTHSSDTTSVHGIANTEDLATKTYADTAVSTHSSDTTSVHGITDTSVLTTASNTQTLTNKTLTSPKINEDVVLTTTATELNYVDGVTSAIQTQIDAKAPLASPTFTGTVAGITKTMVGLGNVDNTADASKPVSTAQQTALDLKSNIAGPTFTGTVTVPTLDVTTTATGITKTMVGLGNVDNTADLSKPVSTAQATAIATAKSEVKDEILGAGVPAALNTLDELAAALGDDANFASSVTTSLGLKAPLASPTFTGTVTIPNGAALGTPASATLTNATGLPVATGIANLGTGVATFLATPSSANLASMVTDEIGTGNLILSDIATNAQSASYTLVLADKGKLVEISNASANTVTVPPNSSVAFPVGSQITVLQTGAGQTTIAAGVGVTVNSTPGLKLRAQWSSVTLIKRLTDTWVVVGDLTA